MRGDGKAGETLELPPEEIAEEDYVNEHAAASSSSNAGSLRGNQENGKERVGNSLSTVADTVEDNQWLDAGAAGDSASSAAGTANYGREDAIAEEPWLLDNSNEAGGAGAQMDAEPHVTPTLEPGLSFAANGVAGLSSAEAASLAEKLRKRKNATAPKIMRAPLAIPKNLPAKVPPRRSLKEEKADAQAAKVQESVEVLSRLVAPVVSQVGYRAPWMKYV